MSDGRTGSPRILVVHDRAELYLDLLHSRFPEAAIGHCRAADSLAADLARHRPEVVLSYRSAGIPGPVHRLILECPSVAWIQAAGAGIEHLLPWDPARVTVTNAAGVLSRFMAEYVVGAVLMTNFGFPRYLKQQARADWRGHPWSGVEGKTLLIVGLGRIGQATAKLAAAAGLRVTGVRRSDEPVEGVAALFPPDRLHDELAEADFVVLHVPHTAETRQLIDAAALARMKPSAILINCARGAVVDEAALIDALRAGTIAGAVLDVFEIEPLPPENPLWTLDNVVITPHVSDSVADWQNRLAAFFCDNLDRWRAGRPLENVVDPARGY